MNFYSTFASAADRFGDRVAVEMLGDHGSVEVRYRELAEMAARAAGWLASRGIERGDRVAILAENSAHWCAAYLGVMRLGAIGVPFDTNYTADQVATLLADSGARLIFASAQFEEVAREAVEIAALKGEVAGLKAEVAGLKACATAPPETRDCPAETGDTAVILYTSGTTSDPKGVVLSHGNLLAEREAAFSTVSVSEHDSVLSVLPLFHSLPQMANLLLPFSVGARVVFLETVNTTSLTRALKERGITLFVVVPQFFYLVHRRIEDELNALPGLARRAVRMLASLNLTLRRTLGINLGRAVFSRIHNSVGPQLRVLITGGARFDPATNKALHSLGFTIQQAYGLTECSAAASITRAGEMDFTSVGRPLPGVEIRIASGEVLIRGPIVMQGYYNRPDQTAATIRDGWLHTGDLGFIDDRGRVHITGRSKDVIVLANGKNIYPEEIEAHYERCPFIAELCVAGVDDRLHALIRPDTDAMRAKGLVNIREMLRFEIEGLSVTLPSHKRILGYDITLDPLPRTTTRKLKRHAVEQILREKALAADAPAAAGAETAEAFAAGDPLAARVLKAMRGAIRSDADLRPDAHLELDIGLDSMNRVELLVHLTDTFQVEIDDEEARSLVTVRDLVEAIRARVPALPEGEDEREAAAPWEQLLRPQADPNPFVAELEKPKRLLAAAIFAVMKVVYAIAWLTAGLRARGREHLPARGPYLICPNHQSFADVFLLAASLPWRTFRNQFFVGAAEYYATPFGAWMARTLNVVPIDTDANLVNAMQMAAEGLRRGKVLVLFPEGERSIDGSPKAFRKGAAILSHHLQAPMVPAAIDGAFTIWPRNQPFNWRALLPWSGTRARITFGPPVQASGPDYAAETSALRQAVVGMWDEVHAERGSISASTEPI
ncbi:MAG TPA: AMP-binding protein [Vicinamibacterales bacterium]